MHKSIATIDSPEFINLKPLDINPLMSSCEIKVLYLGENRNRSYITEEVATEMAKTLRGAPIVGYFRKEKEDFADHGNRMIIDDEGIKFECMTKPYGFVDPAAKVWFQTFEDTDEFGNKVTRKYLMTTGYLWTGQYEECKVAAEEGRPHSMELDEDTLVGHWATNRESGMDFFIINDAIFSKLCILGDDVEPCFEGSSVTAPKVSSNFTKIDDEFKKTLFSMMQELQFALQGGQQMEDEVKVPETEVVEETPAVEAEPIAEEIPAEEFTAEEEAVIAEPVVETEVENDFAASKKEDENESEESSNEEEKEEASEEDEEKKKYAKKEDEEEKEEKAEEPAENSDAPKAEEEEEDEKKKKFELLETEFAALQEKYSELEVKYNELVAFKAQVEDAKKDEMISKFCFLSDEDKKEVIENKSKYSVDEIEAKLSVICVRNKVNFDLDDDSKNDINTEASDVTTYNLSNTGESIPAWIMAVQNNRNK
jgi:hypothetical protein